MPTHDDLRREGRADAVILLVLSRRVPTMDASDWARILGVDRADVDAALTRLRERQRVQPRGSEPCPEPGCNVVCIDRRGLAMHLRSHKVGTCAHCGRTFALPGLGHHQARCQGASA